MCTCMHVCVLKVFYTCYICDVNMYVKRIYMYSIDVVYAYLCVCVCERFCIYGIYVVCVYERFCIYGKCVVFGYVCVQVCLPCVHAQRPEKDVKCSALSQSTLFP